MFTQLYSGNRGNLKFQVLIIILHVWKKEAFFCVLQDEIPVIFFSERDDLEVCSQTSIFFLTVFGWIS